MITAPFGSFFTVGVGFAVGVGFPVGVLFPDLTSGSADFSGGGTNHCPSALPRSLP
jgi:hypothetical protein